jgi:hypothetical protein
VDKGCCTPFETLQEADVAIYHLRASMISRSTGRSATAAAAYRAASHIIDQRTGLSFDYSKRSGVDHVEILAPSNSPAWVYDRAELWNHVETAEKRLNSQVAREVRVALPAELSHEQRVELVRDFCQRQFVDQGMIADIALHAPGREGDDRNHHAHILLTTREIGPEGFEGKNRAWNATEVLEGWREAWALDTNLALERAGIEERIDHRSLKAQREEALDLSTAAMERGDEAEAMRQTVRAVGLDRQPLPQLSAGAWQLKERGIEVAAVQVWQQVKAQAVEVARVAQELATQARSWLERAIEVLAPSQGLAMADGFAGDRYRVDPAAWTREIVQPQHVRSEIHEEPTREPEPETRSLTERMREAIQSRQAPPEVHETPARESEPETRSLAERMREAMQARQARPEVREEPKPEPETRSLAERLREAAQSVDAKTAAASATLLREEREMREAEELRQQQEVERARAEQLALELAQEAERARDQGYDHEL